MKNICKDIEFGDYIGIEAIDFSTVPRWCKLIDAINMPPTSIMATGYFISENMDFIHIAGLKSTIYEEWGCIHIIPKTLVIQISKVTRMKGIYKNDKFNKYYD